MFMRITILAVLCEIAARFGLPCPALCDEPSRPNIVFIMADDMGYGDPGCYGQDQIRTPNMDRLAKGGMRCTQAYAGATVRTPSCSCLMTGTHSGHTSARDNIPHFHGYLEKNDVTIAEVLQKAEYRCGAVGN